MSASKQLKVLSVRLPESRIRRVKALAAMRGVSVQQAVEEALESWSGETPRKIDELIEELSGSMAGIDLERLRREEKEAEFERDRRWS